MRYRPEIDGLRAIAVVPVILFHGGFDLFSGGFVGVDVFFVISGYLITGIIINEMASGTFSLVNFWERRARRILPALFFMVLACLPFAWLWFTPSDFRGFSQSMIAVSTFWSNFLFWSESGYFDTAAELKPLLHTWSLAVEEQYYIIFPVFLLVIWQLGKRKVLGLLAFIFVLSLTMAHWGSYYYPAATFFLPHTRTWELLLGAFIAFFLQTRPDWNNQPASPMVQITGLAGLALIGYAVFAFDHHTPFPGLFALVPTVGTALIILFALPGSITNWALSLRPLVGIGLISYSAYLWHQPLFAFVKYKSFGEPSALMMVLLCVLTLPLAWLSWRFVERPFRDKGRFSRPAIFRLCGLTACCLVGLGLVGTTKSDFNPAVLAKFGPKSTYDGPASAMLLGDSHAEHLAYGLEYKLGTGILTRWGPGCIPFLNVDRYDSWIERGTCAKKMRKFLTEFENDDALDTLVLSTMGPVYLDGTPFRGFGAARVEGLGVELVTDKSVKDRWLVFEIGLRNTLQHLSALPNKTVIFTLDVPELGIPPRLCGVYKSKVSILGTKFSQGAKNFDSCIVPRDEFEQRVARYHELIREVLSDFPSVHLFDPTEMFCDEDRCAGAIDGNNLYRDGDHLSDYGSIYVADALAPMIKKSSRPADN